MKRILLTLCIIFICQIVFSQRYKIGDTCVLHSRAYWGFDNIQFKAANKWVVVSLDKFHDENVYYLTNKSHDTIDISDDQLDYKYNPKLCYTMKEYRNQIKRFGLPLTNKILSGQTWINMTTEMAEFSKGKPTDIRYSESKNNFFEFWTYRVTDDYTYYLSFNNDKLFLIEQ